MFACSPHRWKQVVRGLAAASVCLAGCQKSKPSSTSTQPPASLCTPEAGTGSAPDPGRVALRRLSRTEYNNTVRDLLGDTTQPANDFPEDDTADGFDNNGDVLTTSALFTEKALAAAQKLADATWLHEAPLSSATFFNWPDLIITGGAVAPRKDGWEMHNGDRLQTNLTLDQPQSIALILRVYSPSTPVTVQFFVDGENYGSVPVHWDYSAYQYVAAPTPMLDAGPHEVAVESHSDDGTGSTIADFGTFGWKPPVAVVPIEQAHLRICDPLAEADCTKRIISTFAHKAWRRPVPDEELDSLMLLEQGVQQASTEVLPENQIGEGVRAAVAGILSSPNFLYRVETDADLTSPVPHRLEDHELATRLAYTLWATTPDDHLLSVADQCQLHQPDVYAAEIERMLQAPQAIGFAHDFAGQWLKTQQLATVAPDPTLFPNWDEDLRVAMQAEAESLFSDFLVEDRPVNDLLDAPFTFVNDRLAKHYGLPLPGSTTPVKVALPSDMLGGLLSRAGILTVNAHPNQTSPVRRGAWVLTALLCTPPPPPPAGVPPLPSTGDQGGKTMKERLATHRSNPACMTCHASIDPIGLGLENYDAIGQWRTTDQGETIDPSGQLPDGRAFQTPRDLAELIKGDARLDACIAQKLWIYSLGRSLTAEDQATLNALAAQWGQDGNRLGDLVHKVLTSPAFTTRRGGP